MTEAEKNEIVGLVMTQISSQAVDFDIATEQPQANDLLTAVRKTSSGEYMGVTLKWDDVARIATEVANRAAERAEQAKTDANNILEQVQSKGTEITNYVATSKAEIETQKDESVNAVKSVYQTDLDELKGDLDKLNEDGYYYLYNKIDFTGFGVNGASGGITKVGQMYFDTNTKLMRRCVTLTEETETYETVALEYGNCYYCLRSGKNHLPYLYDGSVVLSETFYLDVPNKIPIKNIIECKNASIYDNLLVFTGESANSGLSAGIKNIGDVFFYSNSKKFRMALELDETGHDFRYTDAQPKEFYLNRSNNKYYKFENDVLIEAKFISEKNSDNEIKELETQVNATHITSFEAENGYIADDGTVNNTAKSYSKTKPIMVYVGDTVTYTSNCYLDTSALAFSKDGKTWKCLLAGNGGDKETVTRTYDIAEDGYISLSFNKSFGLILDIKRIEKGTLIYRVNKLESESVPIRTSIMKSFGEQPSANGSSGSFCNTSQGYNELINTVYEPLRIANPNYIKRQNVGKDASGTYDMYVYTFEPRYYQQSIMLVGGVHADEIDSIASLARIMQMITNSDGTNEDLEYIRQNVKITVIPCVNVWGFSQSPKVRTNSDGISIQTWNSETLIAELANLQPVFLDLKNELSFILDMHTTTNDTYKDFYGVINRHDKNVRTIFKTVSWLCDKYGKEGGVDEQYLGYLDGYDGLLTNYWHTKYGVVTSTMELSDYHWDTAKSTSKVITMGVTMFLNYIIQMVNDGYNTIEDIPISDYRPSKA